MSASSGASSFAAEPSRRWLSLLTYMYVYTYVLMYVRVYVCMYVYTCYVLINPPITYITSSPLIRMYAHTHTHTHTHTDTHTHTHKYIHIHIRIHTRSPAPHPRQSQLVYTLSLALSPSLTRPASGTKPRRARDQKTEEASRGGSVA